MADQKISQLTAYDGSTATGAIAYALAGTTYRLTPAELRALMGVESGATADQTGAEIKALYEAEADTNAFDDAAVAKLAGIATGATANSSDATLLDRANHTGTQAISTVAGLQTALDGKLPLSGGTLTGDLGVGVSPLERLHIKGEDATLLINNATGNAGTVGIKLSHSSSGTAQNKTGIFSTPAGTGWGRGNLHICLNSDGDASDATTADAVVSFLNSGNVGVNETSPDYRLDVNGSLGFTPGTSVTPVDNGDITVDFPTAYTVRINGKSGGTIRSLTLPLGYDFVTPEQFGAAGDGSTDDTAALVSAFATGKSVFCRAGANYKISGAIDFAGNNQWLYGNGCTFTATAASFDAFKLETGSLYGCGLRDFIYEGALQTGGHVISIAGCNRTTIENVRIHSPYNFLYAETANLIHLRNAWVNAVRGSYGFKWYGDAGKRSDVFEMVGVTISSSTNKDGIIWDGNCHTMTGQSVRLVGCGYGLRVQNTAGATAPAFGIFHGLEVDFANNDGISLEAGEDFYFANLYSHGATGDGLNVGASVTAGRVIVQGGKITSNGAWGISNAVEVLCQNVIFSGNTSGNISGTSKVSYDSNFYAAIQSGDPYINFDTNDYLSYSRGSNAFSVAINSTNRLRLSNASNAVEIYVNGALKTIQVGAADSGGTGYRMLRVTN